MTVDVVLQHGFGVERLPAARMKAMEVSDLLVDCFHVPSIARRRSELFFAGGAGFLGLVVLTEMLTQVDFLVEAFRANFAVEATVNFLEVGLRPHLGLQSIVFAFLLVKLQLGHKSKAGATNFAGKRRRDVVLAVEMEVKR